MSVLDRSALEASPLADLHTIASELSLDGYRRLRRAELVDAILEKQGGNGAEQPKPSRGRRSTAAKAKAEPDAGEASEDEAADEPAQPRSRSRSRAKAKEAEPETETETDDEADAATGGDDDAEETRAPRRRGRRSGRGRATAPEASGDDADDDAPDAEEGEQTVEGVVELLAGGSGFVRVEPPEPSDDDVYISAAQVKRCELVSGDRISGPKRAPRRSERFASLIRIETINGRPASELADSVRYDELPAAFPTDRIKLGSDDVTLKAIEFLTPFGKGSRVTIVGAARAGKTEALKRIAAALGTEDGASVHLVLAGARPEEIAEWSQGAHAPAATAPLGSSEEVQSNAIEPIIDQARRLAARGGDAVVLIDSLDGCSPQVARKALGAARNVAGGGSLTVIATASAPLGGETTVIALDVALASTGRFPALDLIASGVLRPELLVGQAGADAIAATRSEAVDAEPQ